MKLSTIYCLIWILILGLLGCDEQSSQTVQTIDNSGSQSPLVTNTRAISLAPSKNPPGGLSPAQVPQFVSFGFDDNAYADAIHWIADFLSSHNNPAGSGNSATYDNRPLTATFFQTGSYATGDGLISANGQTIDDMVQAWRLLYDNGNELGNHTYRHSGILTREEYTQCNDVLTGPVGVPASEVRGFRAPFLYYTKASFDILYDVGFEYDCSIEQPWGAKTGGDDYWPFTLDHTSPYPPREPIGSYPGMWEVPVYSIHIAGSDKMEAGFDFNLWATKDLDKQTFLATLKNALDARLAGNRAPFAFGAHTDEYSEFFTSFDQNNATNSTWRERREAIEEFLLYAISHPDVRVVSYGEVVDWMKNPVPLGNCTPSCTGKDCGDDGCGGSCGDCDTGFVCDAQFQCVDQGCTPDCAGKDCGDDGCGSTCGSCFSDETCDGLGQCIPNGTGDCGDLPTWTAGTSYDGGTQVQNVGNKYQCKPFPYNGWAGIAAYEPGVGFAWEDAWTLEGACGSCTPDCAGKNCGDDGCGGSCGTCTGDETCSVDGVCESTCTPDCAGKDCGDDGCGGSCGTCNGDETCSVDGICEGSGGDCDGLPAWTAGTYDAGTQVQNVGNKYQCKDWPYNGWCGMGAYEPGNSVYWTDAWILIGPCQ